MSETIDIVKLIENTPNNKLDTIYNNKFIEKLKNNFNSDEEKLFITNFYCFLNYNKDKDLVIDVDNIWIWLGFNQKKNCKLLIEKNFIINKDYIIKSIDSIVKKNGGKNKQIILLTINCFKSLCLKADTKKAKQIHNYYIKLENIFYEIYEEQVEELKDIAQKVTDEKNILEKEFIKAFPVNTECIYIGKIDNTNEKNEKLIKFGHSNDLKSRIYTHKKTYKNFILLTAYSVTNNIEIENLIKKHKIIKNNIRTINIDDKKYKELIAYDNDLTIDKIKSIIKDIINTKIDTPDNYIKLTKEYNNLKDNYERVKEEIYSIKEENSKLYIDNKLLRDKISKLEKELIILKSENAEINGQYPDDMNEIKEENNIDENTKKYYKFIEECCIVSKEAEVYSLDIIGQFRIWNAEKPKRELFEGFTDYLKQRFIEKRIKNEEKQQIVHAFKGITLKPLKYNKVKEDGNIYELFIFNNCKFHPSYKEITMDICEAGLKYLKNYNNINIITDMKNEKEHIKNIKEYLKSCPYTLGGPIRSFKDGTTQEGYYGICLKENIEKTYRKNGEVSGKSVEKVDLKTDLPLETYKSIIEAANKNDMNESKMRRIIKLKITIDDSYYFRKKE